MSLNMMKNNINCIYSITHLAGERDEDDADGGILNGTISSITNGPYLVATSSPT